jgi:hypothetical protein
MNNSVPCPDCGGRKVTLGFVDAFSPSGDCVGTLIRGDCCLCNGEGVISVDRNAQIIAGEELRADRLRRNVSIREEAARLGISPSELSRRERGRFGALGKEIAQP